MASTFSTLESDLRDTLSEMYDLVKSEWDEYQKSLIQDAFEAGAFLGEWDKDQTVLEGLHAKTRLRSAEEMQKNTSTWSGGAGQANNVVEGVRNSVASEVFNGGMNYAMYNAYRAIVGTK